MGLYSVDLAGGISHQVELSPSGHLWQARVDGREFSLRLLGRCERGLWVEVNGKRVTLPCTSEGVCLLEREILRVGVELPKAERRMSRDAGCEERGETKVESPLTGVVWKVLVRVGQRVKAGETLAVIEAMKMENQVAVPRDGVIGAVHCVEGEVVRKGTPLVTLAAVREGEVVMGPWGSSFSENAERRVETPNAERRVETPLHVRQAQA